MIPEFPFQVRQLSQDWGKTILLVNQDEMAGYFPKTFYVVVKRSLRNADVFPAVVSTAGNTAAFAGYFKRNLDCRRES